MKWYRNGLKFKCTGCGMCCTKEPGYVWISDEEAQSIADYLRIPLADFIHLYTRTVFGKLCLKEDKTNYDCVFLKDKKCQVYTARPKQCKTFPWWDDNLVSPETWQETALRCEGIDHPDAPLIPFEIIEIERNS